jgi:hypothetical protein
LAPSNDDIIQRKAGAWTNRTIAQLKTDLAVTKSDVGLGNVDNTSNATERAAAATLANKTLNNTNTVTVKDTLLTIQDDGDATKQAQFQASGITAGQTRVLTIPDASTTLVGNDTAQALTSKTFAIGSNTVTGSVSDFNTALTGADFYTSGGTDVPVADGGTGVSTLTGIVKGNGTSAFTAAAAGTDYVAPGGALGTPASGTLTNCTGLPATSIVDDTTTQLGIGTLELGHASDTTLSRSAAGKLAVEGVDVVLLSGAQTLTGKTLTSPVINTPTGIVKGDVGLGSVDNTADSAKSVASAATLTTARTINGVSFNGSANIVVVPRVGGTASSATPAIDCALYDQYNITALAANITSVTVSNTFDGCKLLVRITGTATRTIAWGASFQSSGVATLLATTSGTNTHMVGFVYDGVKAKFVCMAVDAAGY